MIALRRRVLRELAVVTKMLAFSSVLPVTVNVYFPQ
jgi:hypothetical protein